MESDFAKRCIASTIAGREDEINKFGVKRRRTIMRQKSLLVSCLLLLTNPSLAANWEVVGRSERNGNVTSLDRDSIKRNSGQQIRATTMEVYASTGRAYDVSFDTVEIDWLIVCSDYSATLARSRFFANQRVVLDRSQNQQMGPPPEGLIRTAFQKACSLAGL